MPQVLKDRSLGGLELAYRVDGGGDEYGGCGFMFLTGYRSEMVGKKGEALAEMARDTRRRCLRFDFSGHGESGGDFLQGTISMWLEQATHMFLTHTKSRMVIVGSSMGGWIAQLLARKLQNEDSAAFRRIAGMVLLAPATDMTQELMWPRFDSQAKESLRETGVFLEPSQYGDPYPITAKLLADGLSHCLLYDGLRVPFPVRILQGTADPDVPPAHAMRTMQAIHSPDLTLTLIKGGDHRLSTLANLKLFTDTALALAEAA